MLDIKKRCKNRNRILPQSLSASLTLLTMKFYPSLKLALLSSGNTKVASPLPPSSRVGETLLSGPTFIALTELQITRLFCHVVSVIVAVETAFAGFVLLFHVLMRTEKL